MNTPIWDDEQWPGLATLQGTVEADVCVVGLGGSGLSAIHELRRLGKSVVGLDAGPVAGRAAGRNGGFLIAGLASFHHDAVAALGRQRATALYRLTLAEIDRFLKATPTLVRRTGSLRIATTPEERDDCEKQLAAMRADALSAEPYEGPEGIGLLFPEDAVFQPLARCRRLARAAIDAGATLFEHSPAISIAGNFVQTPAGRVECGAVVVAVDGGLAELLPELAGEVRTARLQMLATEPTAEVRLPRPVYARYGMEYWQQLPGGEIALGGYRDHGGAGEWTVDSRPTDLVQSRLEHHLRHTIGVTAPITHRWAASVGFATGPLPILSECRPGVWAIGGYSGTGNLIGAILGRAAARRVADVAQQSFDSAFDKPSGAIGR